MANNTEDVELTVGVDMGIPGGDDTAFSIRQGDTLYTFVGAEARVLIQLIQQEANRQKAEMLDKISNVLTGSDDFRVEPAIRLDLTIGQIRAIRMFLEAERKKLEEDK